MMSEWQIRFHKHYNRGDEGDCWPWMSSRSKAGYGRFMLDGRAQIASRLAFQIANGPIPTGLCVLHACDNPACVNPKHLSLGSHKKNMEDRNHKGRARGGRNSGEAHPRARLSQKTVLEIRQLAQAAMSTQADIATRFGISQGHVSEIKNGKSW